MRRFAPLCLLCGVAFAILFVGQPSPPASAQSLSPTPTVSDEFTGPFPSWANVQTLYGAAGDGVTDDTSALQAAFDDVGTPGEPNVVYLPAGVYRITASLSLAAKDGVQIVGDDPATTKIVWDGPSGGDMLVLTGVARSKLARLTWDGSGTADADVVHAYDGKTGVAATGNSHVDETFTGAAFGIRGGILHHQDSETAIVRCSFIGLTDAGVSVEDFNALDWWVWDSHFENNALGVTNEHGAGGFSVYNSSFVDSTRADMSIGNTENFGIRGNTSTGSRIFFAAGPIGSASARLTFQNNTVMDSQQIPIQIYNPGPITLLNNTLMGDGALLAVHQAYAATPDADAAAIDNVVTSADPYDVDGTFLDVGTRVIPADQVVVTPPTPTQAAPRVDRPIVEVATGSAASAIQDAIDSAIASYTGQKPIVHLPAGTYPIDTPLTIPSGSDVQIVGDGSGTRLNRSALGPVIQIQGPSNASVRDLKIGGGSRTADGIVLSGIDQPGARVVADGVNVSSSSGSALLSNGLDNAVGWLRDFNFDGSAAGVRVLGGPAAQSGEPAGGHVTLIGVSSGANQQTYDVENNGRLIVEDAWYEGGLPGFLAPSLSGTFILSNAHVTAADPNHGGTPTPQAQAIPLNDASGDVVLQGVYLTAGNDVTVDGGDTAPRLLVLGSAGLDTPWLADSSPSAQVALLRSRLGTAGGGSAPYPDFARNVQDPGTFARTMLAGLEAEPLTPPPPASGATDVLLSDVLMQNVHDGIDLEP